MTIAFAGARSEVDAVLDLLERYFDGLHHSDADLLAEVFHPTALYATVAEGTLVRWSMAEYLPVVAARESPASRGDTRTDSIESIEFAGPVTALARVTCSIGEKHYIDLLTLVRLDGRWWVMSKVFHFDVVPAPTMASEGDECRT
jgi:Putative lumazine-binding